MLMPLQELVPHNIHEKSPVAVSVSLVIIRIQDGIFRHVRFIQIVTFDNNINHCLKLKRLVFQKLIYAHLSAFSSTLFDFNQGYDNLEYQIYAFSLTL